MEVADQKEVRMKRVKGYMWPAHVEKHYVKSLRYESLKWVMERIDRTRVAIQAGGSYGVWPKALAATFDLVYTFEPEPMSFACLCYNCPELNVIKLQAALGNRNKCVMVKRKSFTGHRVIEGHGPNPCFTINTLNPPCCDLISLDVEGFEEHVLEGAGRIIDMHHPVILFEDREDVQKSMGVKPGACAARLKRHEYVQVADIASDKIYVHKQEAKRWKK